MRSIGFPWTLFAGFQLLCLAGGCQSALVGPAPVGPGAATAQDLTPWLATATDTQETGCLMEVNVAATQGSYDTWGLATEVAEQSMEVDVRACAGEAEDFRGKQVLVKGKLIDRGQYNLPLLVASRIVAVDAYGDPLPDSGHHLARAAESDPVTETRDPKAPFQGADPEPTASAN
jgi:hypothetical protein